MAQLLPRSLPDFRQRGRPGNQGLSIQQPVNSLQLTQALEAWVQGQGTRTEAAPPAQEARVLRAEH